MRTATMAVLTASLALVPTPGHADAELTGKVEMELRAFPESALYPGQSDAIGTSMAIEPELYVDFAEGDHAILVSPFLRVDQHDRRRSHVDLRDAHVRFTLSRDFELRAGIARVFWGVAESKHLVNVINQVDLVEQPDAESFLGQPLVQLTWVAGEGVLVDLFAMSGFRERTFAGDGGRLRGPLPVSEDASYASDLGRAQPEGALRVALTEGPLELGLHYFYGTRRDPELRLQMTPGGPVLEPHYRLMHRVGVDAALAAGDTLFKLEAIGRTDDGGHEPEVAVTGGLEHTLVGAVDQIDLGLVLEYSHDDRDPLAALFLEDDLFAGVRIAFNDVDDTTLLVGTAVHRDASSALALLEASRRLNDSFSADLTARFFIDPAPERPEYAFRRDGHVQARLFAHF